MSTQIGFLAHEFDAKVHELPWGDEPSVAIQIDLPYPEGTLSIYLYSSEYAQRLVDIAREARDVLERMEDERRREQMTAAEITSEAREIRAMEKLDEIMGK